MKRGKGLISSTDLYHLTEMWRGEREHPSQVTQIFPRPTTTCLSSWPSSPSLFFVELMMVIWGGSRGRTPYTYLGRYLSCPPPPPPARRIYRSKLLSLSLSRHSAATNHDQVFITRFLRTGRVMALMGGWTEGQGGGGRGRLLRREWEKDAKN